MGSIVAEAGRRDMKPIRLVDLRVLESACGVALLLALLMPFFTVSAQSVVPAPVKVVTSIADAIPQEPLADMFVIVAVLAVLLTVVRILRPASGLPLMLLSLVSFVAAGVLGHPPGAMESGDVGLADGRGSAPWGAVLPVFRLLGVSRRRGRWGRARPDRARD